MLRLLPSYQGDPNPFRIELATDATNIAGCIFWSSSTQHRAGFVVSHGKLVLLGNGLMRLEVHEHQDLISPSWFTRRAVQFVGEIVLGASAERGTLTLSVQGQHVEGTIGLTGKADLGQQSHYQARLVGESEEG
jgi:hypothetical protein